jgi:hypothetical protein
MKIEFDHLGLLVTSVTCALDSLRSHSWPIGDIEEFPSEGTKEVYIGPAGASGQLLLIEPIGDGPYQEAMAKRGPGVHHIAIHVDDAIEFTERISGSGWYLHPKSLGTFKQYKTIWLARPGVPLLVELVQRESMGESDRAAFINRLELPLPEHKPHLADALGLTQLQPTLASDVFISIGGDRSRLADLLELGNC